MEGGISVKKIVRAWLSFVAVISLLSGCTSGQQQSKNHTDTSKNANEKEVSDSMKFNAAGKKLVVYFSMPETTESNHMSREEELSTVIIDGEVLGNTQYVAYVIQQNTGADIFRIEPATPYPMDHSELEDIARKEQQTNARPEIAGKVENMAQYDIIFFGFPNWYYDMPQIMYTFLDQYDFSGKTIVPFVTSGASGFSNTINTIKQMEPDAEVISDGLSISRNKVQEAKQDIMEWLTDHGFVQ